MNERERLAHLLRRVTFGPRAQEVDAAEHAGFDATVARLFDASTDDPGATRTPLPDVSADPYPALGRDATPEQLAQAQRLGTQQIQSVMLWWLDRLVATDHQLHEKLTFFWHGHWATSAAKVRSARTMLAYQQTLHRTALGDFGVQLKAMLRDPALIIWLDGLSNARLAPNENLARESLELFTLGVGHYSEDDVKAAARALTGWQLDPTWTKTTQNPKRHDAEVKTIFGQRGTYDADGLADLLLAHPAHPTFLASRLWFRYASDEPMPVGVRDRLIAAYGPRHDVSALMRALVTHDAFPATRGKLVKQPVEWAVGAMRQLDIRLRQTSADRQRDLIGALDQLGQVPLRPPNVGGWPSGVAWLTTSTAKVRLRAATILAAAASPSIVDGIAALPVRDRPQAVARLLVIDKLTTRTADALANVAGEPLYLIALALSCPEYVVS